MSSNIAIKIENLVKSFGEGSSELLVIDGADFTLNKGEFVALVAPSGAGKTVLLMMIACVLLLSSFFISITQQMPTIFLQYC